MKKKKAPFVTVVLSAGTFLGLGATGCNFGATNPPSPMVDAASESKDAAQPPDAAQPHDAQELSVDGNSQAPNKDN